MMYDIELYGAAQRARGAQCDHLPKQVITSLPDWLAILTQIPPWDLRENPFYATQRYIARAGIQNCYPVHR